MQAPQRIRTDSGNAFAHHTMKVRVPAILEQVLAQNPDYPEQLRANIAGLAEDLRRDASLPELDPQSPHAACWLSELEERRGQTWLGTDWFFAENYVYRQLTELTEFWRTGRDPFAAMKRDEYSSPAHRAALEAALDVPATGEASDWLSVLLAADVFGNRIDLSFSAALERGTHSQASDLIIDDRRAAAEILLGGQGTVHLVADNAGSELSVDLVLVARLLEHLNVNVTVHVKVHPAFVSDAILADVDWFLGDGPESAEQLWSSFGSAAAPALATLRAARASGALRVAPHPFWNGPRSLWELPADLFETFRNARIVLLKGDAHYRRAVGDALWAAETPFGVVTESFPAPLLALRTLKSDPIVGLASGRAVALDAEDPTWRVNGKRGIASLGGRDAAPARGER